MKSKMSMNTVCCIVVTYNRKAILRECLTAIAAGSQAPDTVLVVDNASSDGTREMLAAEFPEAEVLGLLENAGGAGGFAAGFEWAYARGFGYLWVMDDDGVCAPACLETLLRAGALHGAEIIAPLVIDSAEPEGERGRLSFGLLDGSLWISTREQAAAAFGENGFVAGQGSPFNGTLYRREVIERIGFPDPRLFIRGDEVEYQCRYRRAGFRFGTTLATTQRHPADMADKFALLGERLVVNFTGNRLKDYCIFRNKAVIYGRYGNWDKLLFEIPKHLYFFVVKRRGDWSGLRFWMAAYRDGICGKFGRERRFLGARLTPAVAHES
jgi:rhamnopyranosyl-N-acetylglucosaminyl-diphospho-decaprenol beta-1,3/1,4-galactofuranosyltransferase